MTLAPRTWKAIALLAALFSVTWLGCGLLAYTFPAAPQSPEDAQMEFEVTRGCCFAPSMAGLALAYFAWMAGRRRRTVDAFEVLSGLGAAFGLMLAIGALSVMVEPTGTEPLQTRVAFGVLVLLPGLLIMGLSGVLWYFTRDRS
jgi:hypothetical protein